VPDNPPLACCGYDGNIALALDRIASDHAWPWLQ
jgi:hypothetical protein